MPTPCGPSISASSDGQLSQREADELAIRMHNMASSRSAQTGANLDDSLRDIAGELKNNEEMIPQIRRRNVLLNTRAKRALSNFARRFPTIGEGVLAFLEGSSKLIQGARNSVDYQAKALHGKYFGKFVADLEEQGLLNTFRRGELEREIYQEMGEIPNGKSGISGSKDAATIAKIIDSTTADMVAHQNRAGAYITRQPGYVTRQTHDMDTIRSLGGPGNTPEGMARSFQIWRQFTQPLLDAKTYQGFDPVKFLKKIHESLYTGIHGPEMPEAEVSLSSVTQDLAKKASEHRVLHFKDADSAYQYNQEFGTKNLRDQVFNDLFYRSRNIALMENLGPNPADTFQQALLEMRRDARDNGDTKGVDSLNSWALQAAFDTVTGKNDSPKNPSLARGMGLVRAITSMAKMGGVILQKALADKVFLQAEMAHQGISNLDTLGKQVTGMARRTGDEKRALRLMGVAMDGLIGNTISRYTMHTTTSGWAHRAQQKFFDINFMNYWTEVSKGSAAELMSAHLGEHADLKFGDLPDELKRILPLYEITPPRWDAIRSTVDGDRIAPDGLSKIPDEVIGKLVEEKGLRASNVNILRERDSLESSLRTYFNDRVDIAVPTPGAAEKRWMTMGTQAGTPLGEAMRLISMFKSFPLAVTSKILGREVFGRGSMSVKQFILSDHQGKFHIAQLIAMATVAGYLSGIVRDALGGKTPKPLIVDGSVNMPALNEAAVRGAGLGILGDVLFNEFDEGNRNALAYGAGPVLGQVGLLMGMKTKIQRGENVSSEAQKLTLENSPYINLVYLRPVLNYLALWNLQEMMEPGSLERVERNVEQKGHQGYFLKPSDVARRQ